MWEVSPGIFSQLRNTNDISVSKFWSPQSQPLIFPGICHLVKPPSDQLPNCVASSMDNRDRITETFCGWSIRAHLKDKWSIKQNGQALDIDKLVFKSWFYNLLALLLNLWISIFVFKKWEKCLLYISGPKSVDPGCLGLVGLIDEGHDTQQLGEKSTSLPIRRHAVILASQLLSSWLSTSNNYHVSAGDFT